MDYSVDLARIVGALTTDGHLQLDNRRGVTSFYSKNLSEIEIFNSIFFNIFGKKGRVFKDSRQENVRYKLFIPARAIAIQLHTLGVPAGNKTRSIFGVPEFVMFGEDKIRSAYLQSIFDCEGSIFLQNDGRWRLTYTMHKIDSLKDNGIAFLNEVRTLLHNFGIETSPVRVSKGNIRKDNTKSISLKFEVKRRSFGLFYKLVNFGISMKRDKLLYAIDTK